VENGIEKEETKKKKDKEFDWTLVIISLSIIIIFYFGASQMIRLGMFDKEQTLYCQFDKNLPNDLSLPRRECAILKIVSTNLNSINMTAYHELNMSTSCSKNYETLPNTCSGDSYHLARFNLDNFCTTTPCEVDGVICGAYYMTYYNNDEFIKSFEDAMFIQQNISTEAELINSLKECGKNGR